MTQKSEVDSLYNLNISSGQLRQGVLPAAGSAAIAVSAATPLWGAWSAVGVAADIAVQTLVVGFCIDTLGALEIYDIQLGNGVGFANVGLLNAGGAAAIAAAARAAVRMQFVTIIAGQLFPIMLPVPVFYQAGEFICARIGSVAGGGVTTLSLSVFTVVGF